MGTIRKPGLTDERAHLRADAKANRARLVAAARAVFSERGLGAEMKEIAERAGVGIGTIYRNFATKDDLVTAIFDEVVDAFVAATDAALEHGDPEEAIRVYIDRILQAAEHHGQMARAMMSGSVPPTIGRQFARMMADTRMADVVSRGIEAGVFRPTINPHVAAAYLRGLADPLVWLAAREHGDVESTQLALAELFLRGLGTGSGAAS